MRKGLFSLLLFAVVGLSAVHAYDFSVVVPSGQTLYFGIISSSSSTVRVSYPGSSSYYTYSGYTEPTGDLVVPETVIHQGVTYSVTSIGSSAFSGCSGLTSVTIGNSVTSIGSSAFRGCSGLTSVTIGNSVTSIGNYAFSGCSGLTSVTIPNSVTSIGYEAFYNCRGLTSVTIGNSVTTIGGAAFQYCSGLTSVTIPNSVTSIGEDAFYLVKNIIYNGTATGSPWGALSVNGYIEGDFVYADNTKTILEAYIGTSTSVAIPNSVTSIGSFAFGGCSGLTSVTIPNSVTSIGSFAFGGCSGLTSVTIPNSVTSIGEYAFYLVKNIIYNGTATGSPWGALSVNGYIEGDFVYANNTKTSLLAYIGTSTSVTIPNSVTTIGYEAFSGCSSLTTLNFNAINCGDFSGDYNHPFYNSLIHTINIGDSVQRIPAYFAYNLDSLTSVTIGNSVTSIGSSAFSGCSGLTSVTISNSVTTIGDYAFQNCTGLTTLNFNAINCSDFSGSYHPFYNCPIATINIGDSVQRIPAYFAYNLESLTSVTIPNSVTSIGKGAFNGCRSLNILNFNAINCSDFTYSNYYSEYPPFYGCPISTITIGDSVQRIPAYFAYNLDSLTSVTIGNSVTSIGERAFYNCSALTSATIGNSVTSIGFAAFSYCTGLISITIPNSVTTIGKSAFADCGNLAFATISSGINRIEESTFENCTSLVTITIPSNVANIEDKAFNGCSSLHEVISLAVLPPSLGEEIFSATAILKVPCGSADYYNSAASDWTQYFVGIEEICNVTITVTSANENMGTVSGGGEYEVGTEVTITAIPNQGYRFVSWNDGNTDNPRTITVTEDATYIATFEEGVGIESRDMLSELIFYPNPTSGIITFNRMDIMKVEVLDAVARTVAVYENAHIIDISKLTKGYYTMRITTAEGVAVRKVVRN